MALQGVRDYLRTANTWTNKQCGIQEDGIPPPTTGGFYVALDEGGVNDKSGISYYLGEYFDLNIYVWNRIGRVPADYQGEMLLRDDLYLAGIQTLEDLERNIIKDLHKNWAVPAAINAQFGLPDGTKGDKFLKPLEYNGRSSSDTLTLPGQQQAAFKGRALRFRGLQRNQKRASIGV